MRIAKTSFATPLPRRSGAGVLSGFYLVCRFYCATCSYCEIPISQIFDSNCNAAFSGRSNCTTRTGGIALGGSRQKFSITISPFRSFLVSARCSVWAGFRSIFLSVLAGGVLDIGFTPWLTARSKRYLIPLYLSIPLAICHYPPSVLPVCSVLLAATSLRIPRLLALALTPCTFHMACETPPGRLSPLYLTFVSGFTPTP